MSVCTLCNYFMGNEIFCPSCEAIGVVDEHTVFPSSQITHEEIVLTYFKESIHIRSHTEMIKSRCAIPVNIHHYSQVNEHPIKKGMYYTHSSIPVGGK